MILLLRFLLGITKQYFNNLSPTLFLNVKLERSCVITSDDPFIHLRRKYQGGKFQCARSEWKGNSPNP